jgi:uncharacterized protein (TIGR02996 family)
LAAPAGKGYPVWLIPNPHAETFMPPRTPSGVELPEPRPVLAGLLADAREHPEDDGPRLVLADWLEDQPSEVDRARGEFVRIQCEIARIARQDPRCADVMLRIPVASGRLEQELDYLAKRDPVLAGLRSREAELLKRYENVWVDVLRQEVKHPHWWRGLMRVEMRANNFPLRLMAAIGESENARWLESLHLNDVRGRRGRPGPSIFQSPLFAPLHELSVAVRFGKEGLAELVAAPHLKGLRGLGIGLADDAIEVFAGTVHWPCLTRLALGGRLGADAARVLARSGQLAGLTHLSLYGNLMGPEGVQALAGSPHLTRLEALDVGSTRSGQAGVEALAGSWMLGPLRMLGLAYNGIDPAGLVPLLAWRDLSRLKTLSLTGNPLGRAGIEALASSPRLANLTTLELASCEIGAAEAAMLASSPHLAGLRLLTLYWNPIGIDGALALAESPYLGNLALLWVSGTQVPEDGRAILKDRFGDRLKW